jgi:hypothetical protein
MGLIDLKTDLKSLRYGKDRIGGGSSNQPYIKSEIPSNEGDLGAKGGPDFLLRGGLLTPGKIANDTSRLTQMFFDFKSPNGLLFTAKQNVLSRTAVATNGEGKALNNGAYLPTSTILGAAGNPIGLHLNKQGLNPFAGIYTGDNNFLSVISNFDPLGNPVYSSIVKLDSKSRLEDFLDDKINRKKKDNEGNDLFSYQGGPGSILGVGKTTISLSKDRTGKNNPNLNYTQRSITLGISTETFNIGDDINTITYIPSSYTNLRPKYSQEEEDKVDKTVYKLGATAKYFSTIDDPSQDNIINNTLDIPPINNVYIPGTFESNYLIDRGNTLTQEQLAAKESSKNSLDKIGPNVLNPKGYSRLDYNGPEAGNIEKRVNLGNPGKKQKDDKVALDSVNYRQIYKTSANNPNVPETNDLVKFRIGVIDNDNPSKKTNIHFRAFIDSMDDSYSADWQSQKFMGRGENFYRYNGFDRTVSLSWTVVAQSKKELIPMYQKLNYLASVCAPDYSDLGYMRGNLIKLTIGGYLYEQVGIMKGINYTVPQESPWEIGIPYGSSEGGTPLGVKSDDDVKELPHMIKVTGFQFIPIHDFVPSVQKNTFIGPEGELRKYGDERYIALSNGLGENYLPVRFPQTSLPMQPIAPLNTSIPLSTEIII